MPCRAWTEACKESEEEKEAENLVNFAENLDFDRDMEDIEDEATVKSVRFFCFPVFLEIRTHDNLSSVAGAKKVRRNR